MAKTLLLNYIVSDGVGDYYHFQDIKNALSNNPKIKGNETLFSIICIEAENSNDKKYIQIQNKLNHLNSEYFFNYRDNIHDYLQLPETQKLLGEIDQVIFISADLHDWLAQRVQPYLKKGIPIKYIFEHEITTLPDRSPFALKKVTESFWSSFFPNTSANNDMEHPILMRSLGLSPGTYGLKLDSPPVLNPSDAWNVITQNDKVFADNLLACGQSSSFEEFLKNHELLSVYANSVGLLSTFIKFLDCQNDYFQHKNIVIYLSGMNPDKTLDRKTFSPWQKDFVGIERKIELYDINTTLNKEFSKGIKEQKIVILTGAFLSDVSYRALFDLTKMACVSGDTSLELVISKGILPFYHSTNHSNGKDLTINALKKIAKDSNLGLTKHERRAFEIYFDNENYDRFAKNETSDFSSVDLQVLLQGWQKFTVYLKEKCNFYDQLENIFFEDLYEKELSFFQKMCHLKF